MRIQRKIHHLLDNNGIIGRGFNYLPRLNPIHNFDWNEWIYVTDKIDGTTVQATHSQLFKRYDKFKKGDPKKFTASEEERYGLNALSELEPQNKWIFKACNKYLGLISCIPDDLFVYFECFGNKINSTYKGREHDIRVFDFARGDEYLPFIATEKLCDQYYLPIVGHISRKFSGVEEIIEDLPNAMHEDEVLRWKNYELEGWVLRQDEQIAKIRKTDLKIILL